MESGTIVSHHPRLLYSLFINTSLVEQLAIIKSDKKRRKRKKLPEITYDYTQFIPFNLSKEVLEEIKTEMISMQNKKLAPKQASSHRTYHYQKNYAYL